MEETTWQKRPSCSVKHKHACEADVYSSTSWRMYSRAQHTTLQRHTKQFNNIIHTRRPHATQTHTVENCCCEHWQYTVLCHRTVTVEHKFHSCLHCSNTLGHTNSYLYIRNLAALTVCTYAKTTTLYPWTWLGFCGLWRAFLYCRFFFFLNSTSTCWVSKAQTHSTSILPQRIQLSNEYIHSNIRHEVSSSKGKRKLFQNPAFLHHLCQQLFFF